MVFLNWKNTSQYKTYNPLLFQKGNKRPHTTSSYSQAILIYIAIFFSVSPKLLLGACRRNWNILELEQTGGSLFVELSWDLNFFWKGGWKRVKRGGFNIHFLFLALLVASKSSSPFVTIITLHIIAMNCRLYQTVTKSLALIISCINETVF